MYEEPSVNWVRGYLHAGQYMNSKCYTIRRFDKILRVEFLFYPSSEIQGLRVV